MRQARRIREAMDGKKATHFEPWLTYNRTDGECRLLSSCHTQTAVIPVLGVWGKTTTSSSPELELVYWRTPLAAEPKRNNNCTRARYRLDGFCARISQSRAVRGLSNVFIIPRYYFATQEFTKRSSGMHTERLLYSVHSRHIHCSEQSRELNYYQVPRAGVNFWWLFSPFYRQWTDYSVAHRQTEPSNSNRILVIDLGIY